MDRIDPSLGQGMTPLSRPDLLGRTYAPAAPAVRRQPLQQEGTIARIGPVADAFEPTASAPTSAAAPGARPITDARLASLVAARVPGGIDFTEPAPRAPTQSASQTVPLYRHPADRNTVATAVHAGRILDVNG
ncbi:MAG: hypothetical protein KF902_00015 [Phycisphaeraceae bacterium]|nr:hypothetical protein [Phycisphaeraceae bacterium]